MPVEMVPIANTALIVGCGYVGRVLAPKLVARGVRVFGTTRSLDKAGDLAKLGVQPLIASVTQKLTLLAALKPALEASPLDVYYLVPPGGPPRNEGDSSPRDIAVEGARHVLSLLDPSRIRRLVMTSSTGVYSQQAGEWVNADTEPLPDSERGKLLLDAEQVWLESRLDAHVVRLAGIYGPDRIVGLQAVRQQAALVGDPDAWLNLVHVDDAAELLLAVMSAKSPGRIELGSDGTPVQRIEYYNHLAKRVGAPAVRVLDDVAAATQLGLNRDRLQRASSKRCDNVITCRRTGWLPRYPAYRDGLNAIAAGMQ